MRVFGSGCGCHGGRDGGSIDGQEASIYMFGEEDYSAKKVSRKGAAMSFINLPQV
jgi:hypothetical protein